MQKCHLRLECQLDGSSIVGFGSKSSSRYQVVIQCYWFLFTAEGCKVPQCCLVILCGIIVYTLCLMCSLEVMMLIGAVQP